MKYYVCVGGCRYYHNYSVVSNYLDFALQNLRLQGDIVIISGAASGVDSLAIRYASERGFECLQFPADWETHGKVAGPIRNAQMVSKSTHIVAFWDGKSRGTRNLIAESKKAGKPLKIKNIAM